MCMEALTSALFFEFLDSLIEYLLHRLIANLASHPTRVHTKTLTSTAPFNFFHDLVKYFSYSLIASLAPLGGLDTRS